MKFTINSNGADNGFIERLTAAANRKLAPKLARLAARQARHAHTVATHHTAIAHPKPAHQATSHRAPSHRAVSHPAIAAALEAAALHGIIKAANGSGKYASSHDPGTFDLSADLAQDPGGDIASDTPSASPDGDILFDVSLDADFM